MKNKEVCVKKCLTCLYNFSTYRVVLSLISGIIDTMTEPKRKSWTETVITSPRGETIIKNQPCMPSKLEELAPEPVKAIHYEELIADDDDIIKEKIRSEEDDDLELGSDEVHPMCDMSEIKVEVASGDYRTLKVKLLSNERKMEELSKMPEKIKEKSERFGTRDRSEMFQIEEDFNFEEDVKVIVKFDRDDSSQYLDFSAVVKHGTTWDEIRAEQKDAEVIFKTKRMEYFFIMSSPRTTRIELNNESGETYTHEYDRKIMVEFPKGSVQNTTPIFITVLPVLGKQLKKLKNDFKKPIIEDMSPILIVRRQDNNDFDKSVRCTLPYQPLASSKNHQTLVVRLDHDNQCVVSEVKPEDNGNGTRSCEMKSINICSIVQTKQPISDDRSVMNAVRDEFLYLVGEAKRCILLTFRYKKECLIRTEITEIENKDKVIKKMEKEGFRSVGNSSEVITLSKGQRIRADLLGRIKKPRAQKTNFGLFLVFQPSLDTICAEFSFEINNEFGTPLMGKIQYSSDNYNKGVLYTLEFNPSSRSTASRTSRPNSFYSLSRERSVIQNPQLVNKGRPLNVSGESPQYADSKSRGRPLWSRSRSDLDTYANRPQTILGPRGNPVIPRQAGDVGGRINHVTSRAKTTIDVHTKAVITSCRQYLDPQGRGRPSSFRQHSDLSTNRNRPNTKFGVQRNPATAQSKAEVGSREYDAASRQNINIAPCVNPSLLQQTPNVVIGENLATQRSQTDLCSWTNVSTPRENTDMNMISSPQTEDVVMRENPTTYRPNSEVEIHKDMASLSLETKFGPNVNNTTPHQTPDAGAHGYPAKSFSDP